MTYEEIDSTGNTCAQARWDRGQRLTNQELDELTRWSRWGSDGYPIQKIGRHWSIDRPWDSRCFKTKREATEAWEIYIAILIRLSGLAAYERAVQRLEEQA
jgi:hypothetical protein